jgi:glycosyltransferase involved in cell wall biosynthesis
MRPTSIMPPTISIVTPSLNQAQYLEATMSSVLDQRHPGLEYVVVDGGSTDGSVEVIRSRQNELTWWVSERDGGHADAINKGFRGTSGEIMGWINSSDLYLPWTLTVVQEVFASRPEVDWITGVPCVAGIDGVVRRTGGSNVNRFDFLSDSGVRIQQESTFWRRRLWDAAGGLDISLRYAADYDLWARFFAHADLCFVSCALAAFRVHEDRLGEAGGDKYQVEAADALRRMTGRTDARDLRRARAVSAARRVAGRVGTRLLETTPACDWYRHPEITYDFDTGSWNIVTGRRLGSRTRRLKEEGS